LGGVLVGVAIDLPPFLVNENDDFELRTLVLRWGVLAVSAIALYVARPTRLRLPTKPVASSQGVSKQLDGPAKQWVATSESEGRSHASHREN